MVNWRCTVTTVVITIDRQLNEDGDERGRRKRRGARAVEVAYHIYTYIVYIGSCLPTIYIVRMY